MFELEALLYNYSMQGKLIFNENEYSCDALIYDRDSYLVEFNNYWSRFAASISQKIAEHTTNNWNKFNQVRLEAIKTLGLNTETGVPSSCSSPIMILPVNTIHLLLSTSLKNILQEIETDTLSILFQELVSNSNSECKTYIKDSINFNNLDTMKQIQKKCRQIMITNDSKENNDYFLKEACVEKIFDEAHTNINKEQVELSLKQNSVFLTKNPYLEKSYKKRGINNVLLVPDLRLISITSQLKTDLITINIDGASKGNPGPASIGIVFKKGNETIHELSEYLGVCTNNHAEYLALIKALETSLEKGFKSIEVKSDSELVVNQINKKYKVKDADIKELFDRAQNLINNFLFFSITHISREENLKADKLANNVLKNLQPTNQIMLQ